MLSTRLMGSLSPPDLRKLLDDALDKPELQKPLTPETASRYRSAISWGPDPD